MKLSELKVGESAYIVKVEGESSFARRLSELGFIRGQKIQCQMKAPLMNPVEYEIMGTSISLRNSETQFITVSKEPIPKIACPIHLIPITTMEHENSISSDNSTNSISSTSTESTFDRHDSGKELNDHSSEEIYGIAKIKNRFDYKPINGNDNDNIIDNGNDNDDNNNNIIDDNNNSNDEDSSDTAVEDNVIEDFNAELDIVKKYNESSSLLCQFCPEQKRCERQKYHILRELESRKWNGQEMTVALVGNPNCGKTTLFNRISGGHEKEGNYCGVTVDSTEGQFIHRGVRITLIDLPGTYSLASYSPEEKYVENYLNCNKNNIDVILNVLDSNNLERNLFLTLQCQKIGIPMVGALNMYDELEKRGDSIDIQRLSQRLGMVFYPTISKYGKGLREVFDEVLITKGIKPKFEKYIHSLDTSNTGECYAFIHQILSDDGGGLYLQSKNGKSQWTARIDAIVTHKWVGFILFGIIIYVMFGLTFDWVGNHLKEGIELFFSWFSDLVGEWLPEGWVKDLICDGIIAGVGGVTVFLPNILILYLCISFLEDSGYMARAAFILDGIMKIFGLHGKSFIPMICGFGCNVPAVMSTRAIENRKSRLVTLLVISLFSCSARTPLYNVLATAFFPNHVTPIIFSLYGIGVILALTLAKIFSVLLVKEKEMNYLMELPEYRLPSLLTVMKHTWERAKEYIGKMATIILSASIILWFLSNFPRVSEEDLTTTTITTTITNNNTISHGYHSNEKSYLGQVGRFIEPVFKPMGFTWKMDVGLLTGLGAKEIVVSTLNILYSEEAHANDYHYSYNSNDNSNNSNNNNDNNNNNVNTVDHGNKNVIHDNNNNDDDDNDNGNGNGLESLSDKLKVQGDFNAKSAYAYMLFVLLYFPCVATITAIKNEVGWKWASFVTLYTTLLAWVVATSFYQIASLFF